MIKFKGILDSVKDVDSKNRVVTGYLSSFDNIDSDNDLIVKGAYKRTLDNRKEQIYFLNQHNWSQPLSKFNVLEEDDYGLYFESKSLPNTTYADDLIKLYEAGIVKEHSVGFNTIKDEVKDGVRYIKEIKLWEGSAVTLGANSLTPFRGFKSLTKDDIDKEYKLFLNAFKKGTFTDETFGQLEIALQMLKTKSAELAVKEYKESLQPANTHLDSTIKQVEILNDYLKKWN